VRLDNLFQFIVPLTFLAIWALTSLFNREAQPLPPRGVRGPGPGGPRPGMGMAGPRPPLERRVDGGLREQVAKRQASPGFERRVAPPGPVRSTDNEILIIENEPRRGPAPSTARGAPASARRPARSRPTSGSTPTKKIEPATPRNLSASTSAAITGSSTMTMASQMGQPLALNPLALPPSPLLSPGSVDTSKGIDLKTAAGDRAGLSAADFRQMVRSRARLRESFILNEILQPPLSLRPGRRARS
jgi:hypothetical protein